MKCKIALFSVWVWLCAQTVNGQFVSIEGGYLFTQFKGMEPFTNNNGGFQVGTAYSKSVKDSALYLKFGLLYQQYNGIGTITYTNLINQPILSYEKNQELYYLQLPCMLQYYLLQRNKLRPFIQTGLTYQLLLRAWQNPQRMNEPHNVTSSFNSHNFGYVAGGGLAFYLKPNMVLHFSYQYMGTLNSVQKNNTASGIQASALQFGLSFALPK